MTTTTEEGGGGGGGGTADRSGTREGPVLRRIAGSNELRRQRK